MAKQNLALVAVWMAAIAFFLQFALCTFQLCSRALLFHRLQVSLERNATLQARRKPATS